MRHRAVVPFTAFLLAAPALAQEAMYTQAATMPSPNTGVFREQFHYYRFGSGPGTEETERYEFLTSIAYGLARDWALFVDLPIEARRVEDDDGGSDWDRGIPELTALLKWRFYKSDTGGVDTARAALFFGADVPSGSNVSGNSLDPFIGAVYTRVWGRHGFNQDLSFRLNTAGGGSEEDNFGGEGEAEAVFFNTAYLYRIAPDRYTADTQGAWYITAEVNGIYETNSDVELRFSPGLMYEGKLWAFEVMAQLPLYEDVDHRPELDLAVGVGVRLSF